MGNGKFTHQACPYLVNAWLNVQAPELEVSKRPQRGNLPARLEMKKTPETKLRCHGGLNRLALSEHTLTYLDRLHPAMPHLPQEDTELFLWTFAFLFSPCAITLNSKHTAMVHITFSNLRGAPFLFFFLPYGSNLTRVSCQSNMASCRIIIGDFQRRAMSQLRGPSSASSSSSSSFCFFLG